ncbi:Mfm1p [Ascoidea rubescens DSM 1968]|uniref:Magnesium transporter n=1 Tax=Ascoidea rubescens DSM 1968 TaxID=1344418 RepID=A0A1D2VIQ3_9ASCO|nr:cora-domain-containing protein [Ascoidea rubescens DSM 1968]ODV61430.1 cora-domain-containing protein [Ascoidea rubescens DSM 1968]
MLLISGKAVILSSKSLAPSRLIHLSSLPSRINSLITPRLRYSKYNNNLFPFKQKPQFKSKFLFNNVRHNSVRDNSTSHNDSDFSNSDLNKLLEKNLIHRPSFSSSYSAYSPSSNTIRSTIFNRYGNVITLSTNLQRSDLMTKYNLLPRDIRKIDYKATHQTNMVPSILVRGDLILINLLNIRVLIKSDTVILFESMGLSNSHSRNLLLYDLQNKLQSKDSRLPYEIRALEAIFISVISNLDSEMKINRTVIKGVLSDLENHIDSENLRYLLIQNKKLSNFYQKAKLIRDVIDDILDDDEVLSSLYLTNPRTNIEDHAEVEMLLETYFKHCDEIVQIVETLMSNVKTTEEIINIILDTNRNQLMLLGLRFAIGLLSLASIIYVASLYGMNLENFIEESSFGFSLVVGLSSFALLVLFVYSLRGLNKLEKITMMRAKHSYK